MNMNRMSLKSKSKARKIGEVFATSLPYLIYSMIIDGKLKLFTYI
jgi:hypothetical protein